MKTILVVDDEFTLLESLTELLEESGYRVVSASNGKDGLVRVIRERPDLVITDFMMPISDGLEMVRAMRGMPAFGAVPVVVMSASHRAVTLALDRDGKKPPKVWFLDKPFRLEDVLEIIERLIGKGDPEVRARNVPA